MNKLKVKGAALALDGELPKAGDMVDLPSVGRVVEVGEDGDFIIEVTEVNGEALPASKEKKEKKEESEEGEAPSEEQILLMMMEADKENENNGY